MPCYDARDDSAPAVESRIRNKLLVDFQHNSPVAEMLCAVMKILHPDDRPRVAATVPGLDSWWKQHQARDKAKDGA